MKHAVILLSCGYLLLAMQLVLPTEAGDGAIVWSGGAIIWLLIPWLASCPQKTLGIVIAGVYGLAADCVSGLHPGTVLGTTVMLTALLQSLPWETLLKTGPRIAACSFVCSLLPAMAVTSVTRALGQVTVEPGSIVADLMVVSAGGAIGSVILVSLGRSVWKQDREALSHS
ncbi:MAG: hypothetical protein ACYTGL_07145 [Planctomycetota bacterium]|jgi:hypothetical protein